MSFIIHNPPHPDLPQHLTGDVKVSEQPQPGLPLPIAIEPIPIPLPDPPLPPPPSPLEPYLPSPVLDRLLIWIWRIAILALLSTLAIRSAHAQPPTTVFPFCNYLSMAPTLANGQSYICLLDANGNLKVNVAAGGASGGTSSTFGAAFPGTGTAAGFIDSSGNMAGANLDSMGNLKVSGSLTVGGTADNSAFTAGTSTGTPSMGFYHATIDTVTDGRTAALAIDSKRNLFTVIRDAADNARGANVSAGNALLVDASATTQPISAAALPLPAGASTAAKQPALGTAGTASTDVITIQGIASMTKLLVTADALPANQSVNVSQINGVTPLMGAGNTGTGSPRVTIATDQAAIPVSESGTWNIATVTAVTGITNALPAGSNVIGHVIADSGSTTAVTGTVTVAGAKTNNNAAPGATNIGALTVLANAAAPTWTEGDLALLSTDLAGNLRTSGTVTGSGNFTVVQPTGTNLHAVLDTTSTTAVTQATAASLNATVVGTGTFAVQAAATLAAETTKVIGTVRVIGNGGATVDSAPAATAATNLLQVGGIFTTTPTTLTTGQAGALELTATQNLKTDVTTINNVVPLMGNGTTGTGSQRVTIASDNTAFSVNATLGTETTKVIGTVRAQGNLGAAFDAATGAAPPANAILAGGVTSGATGGFMTGIPVCDSFFNINIATATTTLMVTGVSGRHVRICHIDMVALAADNVGIISGTGATCGTGSAAIVGTTSATGYNFTANGGISAGSGIGAIMRTVATGDSVCFITSAATQLSGVLSYAIY